MSKEEVLKQARIIFSTGIMIRDRILRIHMSCPVTQGPNSECCDLSLQQMHAVMITRDRGQVTITELADFLSVSPPSASAMVDRLVDKGILMREHSRQDRRKVIVRVAPETIDSLDGVEEQVLQSFVELMEKIGPETTRKWCEVMERVREVMESSNRNSHPSTINSSSKVK